MASPSPDSLALIVRAKAGDREAWEELCRRYYPAWLEKLRGRMGRDLRVLYATEDLLQSAIAEAMGGLRELRDDAAFFSWVLAISRRKIAANRRKLDRSPPAGIDVTGNEARLRLPRDAGSVSEADYDRLLDAFLALFPLYPEPMGALYLKYFEELDTQGLCEVFRKGETTVYDLLQRGKRLLQSQIQKSSL